MKRLALFICAAGITLLAYAQHIQGTWHGDLLVGNQKLALAFHFSKDDSGKNRGTMDIPTQSARNVPVEVTVLTGDSVGLQLPALRLSYAGRLEGGTIKGVFRQNGMAFPLDLTAGDLEPLRRPQEPQTPLDYKTEEITFTNEDADVSLSGTLTYPVGYTSAQRVPVVLMVTGSGAQNRDEEVFGHKPFAVIADYLAHHGIASLRYDDRGTGKSTGTFANCTSKDFTDDARAGVAWLKSCQKFGKVGVLGHSEGGLIAFALGAEKATDFVISMAGPGIKGDTLLTEQQNAILRLHGQPANRTVRQVRQDIAAQPVNIWLDYFLDYDPAADLAKITVPVMATNGSNDVQVVSASNLSAIKKSLANGNKKNLIKEYPGLNHLFQHCSAQSALDYYRIEETCAPEVLQDIAEWIGRL